MRMKSSTTRILLALAGAEISRNELQDFLRWIDVNGIDQVSEIIYLLQHTAQNMQSERGRGLLDDRSAERAHRLSERQLVSRIEQLMLESKLTKASAVKATIQLLKERGYPPSSIPDSNKIAFRAWIEKLLREIKPEELLNVASVVRNHAVHGLDWPLRREKT